MPCPVTALLLQAGLLQTAAGRCVLAARQPGSQGLASTECMAGPLRCRGLGIGTKLVEQLLQRPETQRCDILLTTLARTIPFYQPWGFRQIPLKEFPRLGLSSWVCITAAVVSLAPGTSFEAGSGMVWALPWRLQLMWLQPLNILCRTCSKLSTAHDDRYAD